MSGNNSPLELRLQKLILIVPVTIGILCFLAAAILQSRSFVVGYGIGAVLVYVAASKFRISKKTFVLLLLSFLLIVPSLAFLVKTDSSLGRLLIYKLSVKILKENFISGVGWGKFEVAYGKYQVDYFKSGAYTTKELLLADNTRYAFNDYLQLVVETGVIGLICLLALVISIIYLIKKALKENGYANWLLLVALLQLIAILVAALFTYVFVSPLFQGLFVLSLLTVVYYAYPRKVKIYWYFFAGAFVTGVLLWIHYGYYLCNISNYKKYQEAKELFGAGFITEAVQTYEVLYPSLKKDEIFLAHYASGLASKGKYDRAILLLEHLVTVNNSASFSLKLAECYYLTGRLDKAEAAYLTAIYMVPNRFSGRYHLFNFYYKTGQLVKAIQMGKDILQLPVKIPSAQVTNIKNDVQALLNKISR